MIAIDILAEAAVAEGSNFIDLTGDEDDKKPAAKPDVDLTQDSDASDTGSISDVASVESVDSHGGFVPAQISPHAYRTHFNAGLNNADALARAIDISTKAPADIVTFPARSAMRDEKKKARPSSPSKPNAEVLKSHVAKHFLRYVGKNNKPLTFDLMKKTFGPMKQPCFIHMWRRHATVTNRLTAALAKVVSTHGSANQYWFPQRHAFLEANIGLWLWNEHRMSCSYVNLQKEMAGVGAATAKVFSWIIDEMVFNIKKGSLNLEVRHEFDDRGSARVSKHGSYKYIVSSVDARKLVEPKDGW